MAISGTRATAEQINDAAVAVAAWLGGEVAAGFAGDSRRVSVKRHQVCTVRQRVLSSGIFSTRYDGVEVAVESVCNHRGAVIRAQSYKVPDSGVIPPKALERCREVLAYYAALDTASKAADAARTARAATEHDAKALDKRITAPRADRVAVTLECDAAEVARILAALHAFDHYTGVTPKDGG